VPELIENQQDDQGQDLLMNPGLIDENIPPEEGDLLHHANRPIADAGLLAELESQKRKRKEVLKIKVHHYFSENALTRLAKAIARTKSEEEKQQVLRRFVRQVVEDVADNISCPDVIGALVNLDYPEDYIKLKTQISDILYEVDEYFHEGYFDLLGFLDEMYLKQLNEIQNQLNDICRKLEKLDSSSSEFKNLLQQYSELREAYEAKKGEFEDKRDKVRFQVYQDYIGDIRSSFASLLGSALEERQINKRIGVLGEYYGQGGEAKVHSFNVGDKRIVIKLGHRNIKNRYPMGLISVTNECDSLVNAYGFVEVDNEDTDGKKQRIEFTEEVQGAETLQDYWDEYKDKNGKKVELSDQIDFLQSIFLPILKGVKAMHDENLIHRDIKPDNVFMVPDPRKIHEGPSKFKVVKLGDFGLTCNPGFPPEDPGTAAGSPLFMSPEQWMGQELDCPSDIFSLGMMLNYTIGNQDYPLTIRDICDITTSGVDIEIGDISSSIVDIIKKCTSRNPDDRPTIDQLITLVEHVIDLGGIEDVANDEVLH